MKKILIIITTAFVPYGGLTTVMLNYYRAMDKNNLQIDFASTNQPSKELLEELKKFKSVYYCLGKRTKLINYIKKLKNVLDSKTYDVVHINGNSATMVLELYMAKMAKVPKRIAHGHTTKSNYPLLHKILYPLFRKQYTLAIATSQAAGDWLFGDNYLILNNAIDLEKYKFLKESRIEYRNKLGLEDKMVVGTIGKLNVSKNHVFLLKVFKEYKKRINNAVLVIVGDGKLKKRLKDQAEELGLKDEVLFLGMREDASEIIQAFDLFVFPSIFEGLGLALIEAQASGLNCIASDVIPLESKVSDYVSYISLEQEPQKWAEKMQQFSHDNRTIKSMNACESIRKCGYDISCEANKLRKIYLSF